MSEYERVRQAMVGARDALKRASDYAALAAREDVPEWARSAARASEVEYMRMCRRFVASAREAAAEILGGAR